MSVRFYIMRNCFIILLILFSALTVQAQELPSDVVKGEDVSMHSNGNLARSLQGLLPGLIVTQTSGDELDGVSVEYRGKTPLVIIDGVISSLDKVNPADVDEVKILRKASASVIYGSQGEGSVLFIKTKNPSKKGVSVAYNGYYSFRRRVIELEDKIVTDGYEWTRNYYDFYAGRSRVPGSAVSVPGVVATSEISVAGSTYLDMFKKMRESGTNDLYGIGSHGQYLYFGSTAWPDLLYRDISGGMSHSLKINTEYGKLSYSVSGRLYNLGSIYENRDFGYGSKDFHQKIIYRVLDGLCIYNDTKFFSTGNKHPYAGGSSILSTMNSYSQPIFVPSNEDGTVTLSAAASNWQPIMNGQGESEAVKNLMTITGLDWKLLEGLSLHADYAYANTSSKLERRLIPVTYHFNPNSSWTLNENAEPLSNTLYTSSHRATARLDYSTIFGDGHRVEATLGGDYAANKPLNQSLSGVFLSGTYNYKRLSISSSIRGETGSLYPEDNALGISYGVSGQLNITKWLTIHSDYLSLSRPCVDHAAVEKIPTIEAGLDLSALEGRVAFTGNVFRKKLNTTHIDGLEFSLRLRDSFDLAGKQLSWCLSSNVYDALSYVDVVIPPYNENSVGLSYSGSTVGEIWGFKTDGYFRSNEEAKASLKDQFHSNGVNFRPYAGNLKFLNLNGDDEISPGQYKINSHGDLTIIGNSTPRYIFGIGLDLSWSGIGISALFNGVCHRDWYFGSLYAWPKNDSDQMFWGMYFNSSASFLTRDQATDVVGVDYSSDNWKVTKDGYWTRPVGSTVDKGGGLRVPNDYYLQNAAYLRLKNLSVSYTFPKEMTQNIRIESLRFYMSGENLITFSPLSKHAPLIDPEMVSDALGTPIMRSISLGVDVTF